MTSQNFYGRWIGTLADPDSGETRDVVITSPVIDGTMLGCTSTPRVLGGWAVWLATPQWAKDDPTCAITPDTIPTSVELVATDHPAHLTGGQVLDAVAHALTNGASPVSSGLAYASDAC